MISKHKGGNVNFRASYIFSANDVIANIGVIISRVIVLWTGSQGPTWSSASSSQQLSSGAA
ncbi:hypothetical protein [Rubripirellula amarantea]|uniref:hypothetical protein n=1 Tax=Rubripirellula amarantea TaxID=2527999 RepID=UPI0013EF43D3|nr:hypothetical protein [Rubripirellula amarantea]